MSSQPDLNGDSRRRRFDFCADGNAARRDPKTKPRHVLIGFARAKREMEYHAAGDDWIRARPTRDVLEDREFVAGFSPMHAARIGAASERARAENAQERVRDLRRIVEPG